MDFVKDLPQIQSSYESIWVIEERLTKSAHFIPIKFIYLAEDYTRIFIDDIVCCNGIPLSIISDQG